MRCLTLAELLQNKLASVSFICREHQGHLCDLIEERGFVIHRLCKGADPAPPSSACNPYHAPWLGVRWDKDAEDTARIISAMPVKPDWLIVDHYALDYRWEEHLRSSVQRIFVIDDLADRVHDCDLLLDQNLVEGMGVRYNDKVPPSCGKMLGPEYALLQPIYAYLHERIPPREGPVRQILIFFGGVDKNNLTGLALSAIMELSHLDLLVDVVISDRSPHYDAIRDQFSCRPGIILHSNLPSLAPLIAKADIAIGAAGTTSWERLCLGLPAVVVTTAENQREVALNLNNCGLIKFIGENKEYKKELFFKLIKESLYLENIFEISWNCKQICDGKGIYRILTIMNRY
jgi:UDP-2,4-diacetamido-2,4,6-trideoxy-beta-L-altropyranose hydrolase